MIDIKCLMELSHLTLQVDIISIISYFADEKTKLKKAK